MSLSLSILCGRSEVWRAAGGRAGRRAAGGVSVRCCGWSGVTYLEPLPGVSALWEEERQTAVLLVWTKWLRDHCQRELTERLPWLSAPLSGSTQNVFPRSRFSLCIRGSQPVASRPAGDLNKNISFLHFKTSWLAGRRLIRENSSAIFNENCLISPVCKTSQPTVDLQRQPALTLAYII